MKMRMERSKASHAAKLVYQCEKNSGGLGGVGYEDERSLWRERPRNFCALGECRAVLEWERSFLSLLRTTHLFLSLSMLPDGYSCLTSLEPTFAPMRSLWWHQITTPLFVLGWALISTLSDTLCFVRESSNFAFVWPGMPYNLRYLWTYRHTVVAMEDTL